MTETIVTIPEVYGSKNVEMTIPMEMQKNNFHIQAPSNSTNKNAGNDEEHS